MILLCVSILWVGGGGRVPERMVSGVRCLGRPGLPADRHVPSPFPHIDSNGLVNGSAATPADDMSPNRYSDHAPFSPNCKTGQCAGMAPGAPDPCKGSCRRKMNQCNSSQFAVRALLDPECEPGLSLSLSPSLSLSLPPSPLCPSLWLPLAPLLSPLLSAVPALVVTVVTLALTTRCWCARIRSSDETRALSPGPPDLQRQRQLRRPHRLVSVCTVEGPRPCPGLRLVWNGWWNPAPR